MGDEVTKDEVITLSCKKLLDEVQELCNGATTVMQGNTNKKHSEHINVIDAFDVGICPFGLFQEIDEDLDIRLNEDYNLDVIKLIIETYLLEKQSEFDFEFDKVQDLSNFTRKVKNYTQFSFYSLKKVARGFQDPVHTNIWMCRLTPYIAEEYKKEVDFIKSDKGRNREFGFSESLFEALKDFSDHYPSISDEEFVKTYIHEYMHLLFDRFSEDSPKQVVNEAFSWFASYMVLSEMEDTRPDTFQEAAEYRFPSSWYDNPDMIQRYAVLMGKVFEGEYFVSWIIEKQKKVVESSQPDEIALRYQLLPEEVRSHLRKFNSEVERLERYYERFEEAVIHYASLRNKPPEKMIKKLVGDLEHFNPEEIKGEERSIVSDLDRLENANDNLREIMREEVKQSRNIANDLAELETSLYNIENIDDEEVSRAKEQLESKSSPELKMGDKPEYIVWDILVLKKRINESNRKLHDLAFEQVR